VYAGTVFAAAWALFHEDLACTTGMFLFVNYWMRMTLGNHGYPNFGVRNVAVRTARIIVLGALAVLLGNPAGAGETIQFTWQGRGHDVPGHIAFGQSAVSSTVEPGRGRVLVARAGGPAATIVLAANPTRSAQLAATELMHYVHRITGVTLRRTTDATRPFKGPKVLIGESALTRALGLRNADFAEQEYLVATYGDMLVLMGHDEQDFGLIDYHGTGLWPEFAMLYDWGLHPEVCKQVGTVYAAHTFLEQTCGVRWYMPGDLGEVCPRATDIAAQDLLLRRKPWTTYRWIYPNTPLKPFNFMGSGRARERMDARDINLWHLRMKMVGIEAFAANHSLIASNFDKRFADDPEKLASILSKGYEHPTQLCLSSPELFDAICRDADDYFAGKSLHTRSWGQYLKVMPHDTQEYCLCDACQALLRPEQHSRGWGYWGDRASDYTWDLVNRVAGYLQERHPGAWASCCAYSQYTGVPEHVELRPNVAVKFCRVLIEGIKDPAYKEYYRREMANWAQAVPRWFVWEYFDHIQMNGAEINFPGIFLHEIADDIQFLKAHGCRGLFNELNSGGGFIPNYAQDHLNVYVQLQLLNDASLDVDAMLDEYCRLFYGPAADPMQVFFRKMEDRFARPKNWQIGEAQTDANWDVICPPAQLAEFRALLDAAALAAVDEPYATRVRLIREAVYGMMARNCMQHFVIMKSTRRKITVPRVAGPAALDTWGVTNHVSHFMSIKGETTETRTQAWVGYDGKNLYVTIRCEEEDMAQRVAIVQPTDKVTTHICADDTIELFIDPGHTRKHYIQVLGNSVGALLDASRTAGESMNFDFETGVTSTVTEDATAWTIAFTIPLANLTGGKPVAAGDTWGLNICRDRPRKGVPRTTIWTCWCPTGGQFHVPEKFGVIEFASE